MKASVFLGQFYKDISYQGIVSEARGSNNQRPTSNDAATQAMPRE
jgi:hypothetical protein